MQAASGAGAFLQAIDVATGRASRLRAVPPGAIPLGTGPSASTGLEVGDHDVALSIPGGDPVALDPDAAAVEAIP